MRDLSPLTSWNADWKDLRVAVLGLGVSGFSVADTMAELGAQVIVIASTATSEYRDLIEVIGAGLIETTDLSSAPQGLIDFCPDLVVVSPGFHPDHPLLVWAESRAIPVWGDIELAWRVRDKVRAAEWICVTGTNGKTTTVQLAAHILAESGVRTAMVGNIGFPVLDAVRDPTGFDVLVVELSSYQLHWINRNSEGAISPFASVCLNLADDHLDWHGSAQAYEAAKAKVYQNTHIACVYNKSDAATIRMVEHADVVEGARAIGFDLGIPGKSDLGMVDDIVVDRAFHDDRHNSAIELTTHGELKAAGLDAPHSLLNVLAAAALCRAWGVEPGDVRRALSTFRIDHHRTEIVAEADGVTFVDDSKATNPHAADASLSAFSSVVWIVGGLLKGVDINALVQKHVPRLRAAVIIGVERSELVAAFQRHAPLLPVFEVDSPDTNQVMAVAIGIARDVAATGDTVLLAPAAASMDQFLDYADRGNKFAEAVNTALGGARNGEPSSGTAPQPR
ncbi:MAG: UDP-N-acetylmuramoyl-L-alanine--D-glutamate ligase [Microbacteriaceae bacterium]